jgi:hypothetical protein
MTILKQKNSFCAEINSEETSININQLIRLAASGYCDNGEAILTKLNKPDPVTDPDSLATFVIRELRSTYDASKSDREQLEDAITALGAAAFQLEDVALPLVRKHNQYINKLKGARRGKTQIS